MTITVLMVAEKPSLAASIAQHLSGGMVIPLEMSGVDAFSSQPSLVHTRKSVYVTAGALQKVCAGGARV